MRSKLLFFLSSDVDECKRFQPEVCKNGVCVNNIPGYSCYCSSGYVYNSTLLECVGAFNTLTHIGSDLMEFHHRSGNSEDFILKYHRLALISLSTFTSIRFRS